MQKKVAIEAHLTNVNQALQSAGFQTVQLQDESNLGDVGAIVTSGQDQNFLGMHTTNTKIPVISAEGRTADEVVSMVQNRIS